MQKETELWQTSSASIKSHMKLRRFGDASFNETVKTRSSHSSCLTLRQQTLPPSYICPCCFVFFSSLDFAFTLMIWRRVCLIASVCLLANSCTNTTQTITVLIKKACHISGKSILANTHSHTKAEHSIVEKPHLKWWRKINIMMRTPSHYRREHPKN